MEEKAKMNIYFKAALVFIVLIVLPMGSIYFFTKGRDFNREVFEELTDKGKVSAFTVVNQNNLPISAESFLGKVGVVNFFASDAQKAKSQAEHMGKVHGSFDDTEDVLFLSFLPADSTKSLLDRSIALGIEDGKQWSVAELDAKTWDEMKSNIFKVPDDSEGMVLMDTSLSIRHYYNGYNDTLIGNLVLHISKVIPKQKRRGL